MNDQPTHVALVQKVRTFADDVRRAKGGGSVMPPIPQETAIAKLPPPPTETPRLADEKKPLDIRQEAGNRTSQEGTVITDTRRKRWSLGKALGQSLNIWIDEQKDALKEPGPNVPPLDTRTKVMQAARGQSLLAPQDDRHAVVEKLRTFAHDAERITGKSYSAVHVSTREKTVPRWSSATDNQTLAAVSTQNIPKEMPPAIPQARRTTRPLDIALQPAKSLTKDVAPVAKQGLPEHTFVEPEEKSIARPITSVPIQYGMTHDVAPLAEHKPEREVLDREEPAGTMFVDQDAIDARHKAIEQLLAVHRERRQKEVPATAATLPPPLPPSRDIAFTPPTFAAKETSHFRTYRDDAIHDVEENKLSIPNIAAAEASRRTATVPRAVRSAPSTIRPLVIAGMVMVVIIAIGGFGLFWFVRQSKQENATSASIPTFIKIDAQKPVAFSTSRAELLSTLVSGIHASGAGITQLYPTHKAPTTGTGGAVATSDFMNALNPRAPGSFIRNLDEEMMLGASGGTDPFFIFKTKQFDTAFAGMLDWEQYISNDLAPLFGSPVSRTQDLTIRIVDQTRPAHFVDQTLRNVDVRILYDETGKERILYAFLNKNTLVITTSSSALIELISRLQ